MFQLHSSSLVLTVVAICTLIKGLDAYRRIESSGLNYIKSRSLKSLPDAFASLDLALLRKVEPAQAQGEFYFFFFGGSGALGIGFAQIPKLYGEYQKVQGFGNGVTKGGPDLEVNPLATLGFPEPLKVADVKYVIDKLPSVEEMLKKGPKKSYMAQLGYIEREGFNAALPADSNPLVAYAAFEALAKGGGELVAPTEVAALIQQWKSSDDGGLEAFKSTLLAATARKYSAFASLFFLIALVFDLIIESGLNAFT